MNENSRTLNSMRNISTGIIGQLIQTVLGFISRTIFIYYLSSEYLGISGLFGNILSILSLAELGIGSAIIYALYKPLAEKNENQLKALMNFYSKAYRLIGVMIGIIGLCIIPFLNMIINEIPDINENINIIFFFYLFNTVISYFYSYKNSIIIADQKNYISAMISYTLSIIQTLSQIFILIVTRNFIFYLIIQAIFTLIYNIIISKIADNLYPFLKNKKNPVLDKNVKKDLITNIKALMIVKLSGVLVNNTDNLIITYFVGLSTVGVASNYTMLIGIVNTFLIQIFSGITASVGNLNANEPNEKKEDMFNIINFANFWLFGFACISIIVLLSDIINIWLGENYILHPNIPLILAINFYMVGMQNAIWTYKNTMGLFRHGKYLLLVTAGLNLILSIFLGNKMGLFGVLLSTAISRMLTNTWYDPYIIYKHGFNKSVREYCIKYLKFIIILVTSLIVTNYLCSFIIVTGMLTLLIKLILCSIISNLIFLITFYHTKELKYFIDIFRIIIQSFSKHFQKRIDIH